MAYVALPAARVPRNAMLDFSGLNSGLDSIRQTKQHNAMMDYRQGRDEIADARANEQLGMQREGLDMRREQFNREKQDRAIQSIAGLAQMALEAPPDQQPMMWNRIRQTVPEFDDDLRAAGVDPNNIGGAAQFIIARARGYQDPLKRREAEAGINLQQAQADYYSNRGASAGVKRNVVGGKIVETDAAGNTRVIYDGDISEDPQKLSGISGGLQQLADLPADFTNNTFESAVGPLQGQDTTYNPIPVVAKVWGSIANIFGDRPTTEVRNRIAGDTEALAAAIKPLIRKPGEGVWTDADQARLVAVVGNLALARNKEEYRRALDEVRNRVRANFGIELPPINHPKEQGAPPSSNGGWSARRID